MSRAEAFVDNFLAHYASEYYDPAKAREYYLRTRELKGKQTSSARHEEISGKLTTLLELLTQRKKDGAAANRERVMTELKASVEKARTDYEAGKERLIAEYRQKTQN